MLLSLLLLQYLATCPHSFYHWTINNPWHTLSYYIIIFPTPPPSPTFFNLNHVIKVCGIVILAIFSLTSTLFDF